MQKIPLSLARPGMLLAEPICSASGMIIIGKGRELSDSLLARLRTMEVGWVLVESVEIPEQGSESSVWSERAARLDHLFRRHAGDAWMDEMKDSLKSYFLMRHAASAARQPARGQESASGDKEG